jgi:hypothetical protein
MFQCGASRRQFLGVRTGMELRRPDGSSLTSGHAQLASGRRLKLIVRTRATYLLITDTVRVQTALIHRSDGEPTEAIYTPKSPISPSYPTKSLFWALVSIFFFEFLELSHPCLSFCAFSLPFQVFFFFFQFIFFKLLEL